MNAPADLVLAYILAKDGNRPHLLDAVVAESVELRMVVHTDAISFPPTSWGRQAFVDTLVRRFNQTYENIYTFCLGAPPQSTDSSFSCRWLVAMSEKESGAVRVGCGRYEWLFEHPDRIVTGLLVHIDAMEVMSPDQLTPVMAWVSRLSYPWCEETEALEAVPALEQLDSVVHALRKTGA